jgi:hypothetical protein
VIANVRDFIRAAVAIFVGSWQANTNSTRPETPRHRTEADKAITKISSQRIQLYFYFITAPESNNNEFKIFALN